MLIHVLDAPSHETSRRFGPEVVSGSCYLEDKEQLGLLKAFFYVIAVFMAFLFATTIVDTLFGAIILNPVTLFVVLPFTIWCLRQFCRSLDQCKNYRAGRKAEESVVDVMRSSLDSSWTIFRNLILPAKRGDVDILLVSRQGLWAIEVKAYKGTFRLRDGELERWKKGRWAVISKRPGNRVRGNAAQVRDHFSKMTSVRWVPSVLVMWEAMSTSIVGYSDTQLWTRANLSENLQQLKGRSYLSQDDYEQVIKTLKELAAQSAAS